VNELESLEALRSDEGMREVILRMGRLARQGELNAFMHRVANDPELCSHTKAWVGELADDVSCLMAVETYLATPLQSSPAGD
jgi:ribosome assembly protein YihI (activator of Der GTPase)